MLERIATMLASTTRKWNDNHFWRSQYERHVWEVQETHFPPHEMIDLAIICLIKAFVGLERQPLQFTIAIRDRIKKFTEERLQL